MVEREPLWYNEVAYILKNVFFVGIVSVFCEIDDFFLAFEKYKTQQRLPEAHRLKNGLPSKFAGIGISHAVHITAR